MSVNGLIEKLKSAGENGQEIDYTEIRRKIDEEWEKTTTIDDRVKLLKVFNLVMDLVERNLERNESPPNLLQDFRNTREADYRLFLVRESMLGENVCAETLAAVTQREVSAGRMTPDHTLYTTAQEQVAKPHYSRAELVAIAAEKAAGKKPATFLPALSRSAACCWSRSLGTTLGAL